MRGSVYAAVVRVAQHSLENVLQEFRIESPSVAPRGGLGRRRLGLGSRLKVYDNDVGVVGARLVHGDVADVSTRYHRDR